MARKKKQAMEQEVFNQTDETEQSKALASENETNESGETMEMGALTEIAEGLEDELGEGEILLAQVEEEDGFLPEASDADFHSAEEELLPQVESVEGTELDEFESADIEESMFVEESQLDSIIESILFASDRPVSLASIKLVFKGTNIRTDKIKRSLDRFAVELAGAHRGVTLEEVPGGYQLRTKVDNLQFITRTLKARQFKLSGPALEVLAIAAYKQPIVKSEIDEIRGVESGHLLRALMEKGLITFEGKSDLPGKPMQYGTTKKFLEIFGLRNLKELPTLSQIDELLPEGMTEEEAKPTLGQLTDSLSQTIGTSYSEGEEELGNIVDQLNDINTSSDFFEQEKIRQRQKRDAEKAQTIRDALTFGEEVSSRDRNWLTRYDEALVAGRAEQFAKQEAGDFGSVGNVELPGDVDISDVVKAKIEAFDSDADVEMASDDSAADEDDEYSVDDDLAIDLHDDEGESESQSS